MDVILTFAPKVTRPYRRRMFDAVPGTGMFVPYGKLVGASVGEEAARVVRQTVLADLIEGCLLFSEDHIPLSEWESPEMVDLRDVFTMAFIEAIATEVLEVQGIDYDREPQPEAVIVLGTVEYVRPWGQPDRPVRTVVPVSVFANRELAMTELLRRSDETKKVHDLLRVNVNRWASKVAA